MRTEVTRSPYCGLPVSRCWTQQEAFQDQTLALACHSMVQGKPGLESSVPGV